MTATKNTTTTKSSSKKRRISAFACYAESRGDEQIELKALRNEFRKLDAEQKQEFKAMAQKLKEARKNKKRVITAYNLFMKAHKDVLSKQSPEMTFAERGRATGAAWKALDNEEKEKFKAMAVEANSNTPKE